LRLFLSIIIPAHNEEHRLPKSLKMVLSFLQEQPYQAEIIIVENGSHDRTAEIAQSFVERHDNLHLIREAQAGKGLAVRRGMLEANGDYRFICDADLSMPIEEINRFLPPNLQNFDIAIASREVPGAVRYGEPLYRHFIGRAFNWLVRLIAVPGIHDTQCGFKAFRREAARDLFENMLLYQLDASAPVKGALLTGFDVEILFMARKWGYQIVEVPVHWSYGAESKVHPIRDSWRNLRDVLLVRWNDLRGRYAR